MSKLLKRWNWSWQQPKRQDVRRDEDTIAHRKTEIWPALKNQTQDNEETLVFIDEPSFHLCSNHQRTFAPVGRRLWWKGSEVKRLDSW
jgi:hypothetical protein